MQQALIAGLTSNEFWASIVALCAVGLLYFGLDTLKDDPPEQDAAWRWGEAYRRPKPEPTWGKHGNCACAAALMVSVTLGAMMH